MGGEGGVGRVWIVAAGLWVRGRGGGVANRRSMDFLHNLDATEEGLHVSHWDDVAEGRDEIDYSCRAQIFRIFPEPE